MSFQAFEYAEKLVGKLSEPEQSKAVGVLQDLLTPALCWKKFLKPDEKAVDEASGLNEDDLETDDPIVVPAGPLAVVKESFNKATGLLFDLLLNLVWSFVFRLPSLGQPSWRTRQSAAGRSPS